MFTKLFLRSVGTALFLLVATAWYLFLRPAIHVDKSAAFNEVLGGGGTRKGIDIPLAVDRSQNYAYVFYATEDTYACSALVNTHRLRNLLNSTVPIILIAGPDITHKAVLTFEAHNITVVRDIAPPLGMNGVDYYTQVLLKLRAFRLHQVNPLLERVIVLDSDQLIRKNIDHLFNLPRADIAAPLMYWGGGRSITTTLMVATLSDKIWKIIDNALHHMLPDEYDMDLINRVMQQRLMVLPGRYCTLNSHWEAKDIPGWFKGTSLGTGASSKDLVELYDEVEVLHFTAMGKPWNVFPDRILEDKPNVHPLFIEQFVEWHRDARDVCNPFWEFEVPPPRHVPSNLPHLPSWTTTDNLPGTAPETVEPASSTSATISLGMTPEDVAPKEKPSPLTESTVSSSTNELEVPQATPSQSDQTEHETPTPTSLIAVTPTEPSDTDYSE